MDSNRVFRAKDRFGAEIEFYLKPPSLSEETEAEMQYRIAYSEALKANILPREKMRELMKEHGIWNEEDEKKLQDVIKKIALNELTLKQETPKGNREECVKIANDLFGLRTQMWQLFVIQQSVWNQSCEGYAEVVRQESLMAACTLIKASNKRYWKNYKEYVIERDENTNADVVTKVMNVQSNLLNDVRDGMLKSLPENQWLELIKTEFLEKEIVKAKEELTRKVSEATYAESNVGVEIKEPNSGSEIPNT